MTPSLLSSLSLAGACLFIGCDTGIGSTNPSNASAQDSKEQGGAPAEKNVQTSGDPALEALTKFIGEQKLDTAAKDWRLRVTKPPQVAFAAGKTYTWKLETSVGDVHVKLMPDVAPMHVSSTIYLTLLGFYDGISFHRVINGFMAQGGCPYTITDPARAGTGGPAYKFAGEFKPGVTHNKPGLLSMANAGPGTDGSQFFLTFVPTPHLDGKHTIFGEVLADTMPTVKELEKRGSRSGNTTEPLLIKKASIEVK
jgi:cyclophilin family peptidyl-prolyl cis-trans isomerase